MALQPGYEVYLKKTAAKVSLTDEPCASVGGNTFQIVDTTKQVLDINSAFTVDDDGLPTTEGYTISYLDGKVIFDGANPGRGDITISGYYRPMVYIGQANSYSRNASAALIEVPIFRNARMQRIAGQKSCSGTLTNIDISDTYFIDAIESGELVVIEDRFGAAGRIRRTLALFDSVQFTASVSGASESPVSWQSADMFF
jgi:hypothetical protein